MDSAARSGARQASALWLLIARIDPLPDDGRWVNCGNDQIGTQRKKIIEGLPIAATDVQQVRATRYHLGQRDRRSILSQIDKYLLDSNKPYVTRQTLQAQKAANGGP